MRYHYAYQNANGINGLSWKHGPPRQTKAADCQSLGSLGGDTLGVLPLAKPGAPEPVGAYEELGLGCSGPCSGPPGPMRRAMSDYELTSNVVGLAAVAGVLWLVFRKKGK